MIAAVDAQYDGASAGVACVTFLEWSDPAPSGAFSLNVDEVEAYVSGAFWRRELPVLLRILETLPRRPELVVVDGYVWLDAAGRRGLGAHLYDRLGGEVPVVGVAKRPFLGSPHAAAVLRGGSRQPLFVTAQGVAQAEAAGWVREMAGDHRIPTLLGHVDRLARACCAVTDVER